MLPILGSVKTSAEDIHRRVLGTEAGIRLIIY